jgi:hypothetical protein
MPKPALKKKSSMEIRCTVYGIFTECLSSIKIMNIKVRTIRELFFLDQIYFSFLFSPPPFKPSLRTPKHKSWERARALLSLVRKDAFRIFLLG